jgi:hypothetical protein
MSDQSLLLVNIFHFHHLFGHKRGLSKQKILISVNFFLKAFLRAHRAYAQVFYLLQIELFGIKFTLFGNRSNIICE